MSQEIIEKIKKAIEGYKDQTEWEEIGRVVEVGDGILKISGLLNARAQEVLEVEISNPSAGSGRVRAVALNLEEDSVGALVLGNAEEVKSGDIVKRTKKLLSVFTGDQLLGRVVDALGNPIDGKGPLFGAKDNPQFNLLENNAPNVIDRESVNYPLHTGIKAIDSMIPIGKGQRELIIGDRGLGKTAIAIDTIINQRNKTGKKPVICIYVAIGQKQSNIARVIGKLEEEGALSFSIIVSAPSSFPATLQYIAPYAGCAIAEYFLEKGEDILIVYDDLTKHAWAYRQLSLVLRRPAGREAYPGDIFYLHSRLLERAVKLNGDNGGGSITALPIIETQANDISAYIPTNVISITDGQIFLQSDLFNAGQRPAINIGTSVSRVGGSAQTQAMKSVAGKLKLELAQYRELAAFSQFGSELDPETAKLLERGKRTSEILKQGQYNPLPESLEILSIWLVTNGHLDDTPIEKLQSFEREFHEFVKRSEPKILDFLLIGEKPSEEIIKRMEKAVSEFKKIFK